jgi:hypothetical protein
MLQIEVIISEDYDEDKGEFIEEFFELRLEHSLLSLSKWESFFEKPFLSSEKKTTEEFIAHIQAMMITPKVPPEIFEKLSQKNFNDIAEYIESKQSATIISEMPGSDSREIITSEVIYSWLVLLNIPFIPTESWHLNRLLNLVKVCKIKTQEPKKMSRQQVLRQNRELNEKRKRESGTRG